MSHPWFISYRPPAHPACRLFCIPFAGGGASAFRSWQPLLPLEVELLAVQAPGREGRFREAPLREIDALLEQLGPALARQLDRPYAIFGHSLGALVAFELTRWLRRHGLPLPHRLFLSGRRAASMPLDRKPYHDLPDDELLDEIGRMGGTDESLLRNRELMEMLLPTMRADFAIHDTYRYRPEPPLPVPFSVFGGRDDVTTPADSLAGWARHTSAGADIRMFEGGHFFIQEARDAVLDALRAGMSGLLQPARAPLAAA